MVDLLTGRFGREKVSKRDEKCIMEDEPAIAWDDEPEHAREGVL